MVDISKLSDKQISLLVENRWDSSDDIWGTIQNIYEQNTLIYENKATWIKDIPKKKAKTQANRVFVNMESVINTLIANPATINFLPTRISSEAQKLAKDEEMFFQKKFKQINWKETLRMGLRNLYFGRLLVIKAFWNPTLGYAGDFDFSARDPRKVRISKHAKNEEESEFVIEEITDTLSAVCKRFPNKKKDIIDILGYSEADIYIKNPEITYKEAWIGDYLVCKYQEIILCKVKNPYFDWDGLLMTKEEMETEKEIIGEDRRSFFQDVKLAQAQRRPEGMETETVSEVSTEAYYFNYFDKPRKPYIFATIFNNENKPIGRTDMISLSASLQRGIDKRKQDIDENCELVNGVIIVDSTVMDKSDAQALRFEARGILWGKNVKAGVDRLTGEPLPQMVFDDMIDSRSEIDNIMAASSAFRGEREGQETKAGRLALIEQSFMRLNELVQVVDYVSGEAFAWAYQLSKINYTEEHYAKWLGKDNATQILGFIQDDFLTGTEIEVIPGKTLPQDAQFRFERAQADVAAGILSPIDYMEEAGYPNPKQLAENAVLYKQNPAEAVGLNMGQLPVPFQPGNVTPEQVAELSRFNTPPVSPETEVLQ